MRSRLGTAALLAAVCIKAVVAQDNATEPTSIFKTRPHSRAPALNVTIQDGFSNGYIFMSPYQASASGPYIYDKFGNLVWDGYGAIGAANTHNFHVCQYQGSDHLCMMVGNQQEGYAYGMGIIVDSDYRIVASVQSGDNLTPLDMHEFWLAEGGETALITAYNIIPVDLSYPPYDVMSQQAYLTEGVFQEINITTGQVLFEWFSSNHVDIRDTRILPHTTDVGGDGYTPNTPFDYFHINSVEKSTNTGNYLISARHTSSLYYINATDRNIIWRLSCTGTDAPQPSDFECQNFNFSMQHDARFRSENDTHTVLSIFDNASNGLNKTALQSSGMLISLDHAAGTASLLSQTFAPPPGGILSDSQANSQHLPNGNIFHGWGSIGAISEHAPNDAGEYQPVLFATFADLSMPGSVMNYRAFSAEWQSTPSNTKPAVYSFALNDTSPNSIYVSWNGATTVARWNFYGADAIGEGEFEAIGGKGREGFETVFEAERFWRWVMVEAVGPDGTSLRNSSFQPTFVPSEGLVGACDLSGCLVSMQAYEEGE